MKAVAQALYLFITVTFFVLARGRWKPTPVRMCSSSHPLKRDYFRYCLDFHSKIPRERFYYYYYYSRIAKSAVTDCWDKKATVFKKNGAFTVRKRNQTKRLSPSRKLAFTSELEAT